MHVGEDPVLGLIVRLVVAPDVREAQEVELVVRVLAGQVAGQERVRAVEADDVPIGAECSPST